MRFATLASECHEVPDPPLAYKHFWYELSDAHLMIKKISKKSSDFAKKVFWILESMQKYAEKMSWFSFIFFYKEVIYVYIFPMSM